MGKKLRRVEMIKLADDLVVRAISCVLLTC